MVDHPELDEINRRLKPLYCELRATNTPCPLVIDASAAKQISLSHHSAGRDATYVHVSRKRKGNLPLDDLAVTIRYAPFVEGTTIIYDLLEETMQGKARPFVCDLTHGFLRMYMLLPFQLERTSIGIAGMGRNRVLEVAFLDSRDEIIQAALPFQLRFLESMGETLASKYTTTNRNGQFVHELPPASSSVTVRSCLTGREETRTP